MHIDPIETPIDTSPCSTAAPTTAFPRVKTKTNLDYEAARAPSRSNNRAALAKSGTRGALRATEALCRAAAVDAAASLA